MPKLRSKGQLKRLTKNVAQKDNTYQARVYKQMRENVLFLLVAFRCINALCIATFFQPDEYFQSLEPAWEIAFGSQSGAWITWEWQNQLRSSLHPAIFAALYLTSNKLMHLLSLSPQFRASVLVALPKVLQGIFAATGDYFTWKLSEQIYGRGSNIAWTALLLNVLSAWQWFCSTRTLSNSLEVVLTVIGLYLWPWEMTGDSKLKESAPIQLSVFQTSTDVVKLRACLLLAGIACILRPTNFIVWASLVTTYAIRIDVHSISNARLGDALTFIREAVLCGGVVICASAISDRLYFGVWTFPPYQWFNFNITQSLAVFYGTNNWHYYLSEGLPLLLTTYLPFSLCAIWSSSTTSTGSPQPLVRDTRFDLTFIVITMVATLSLISHKEVRFIYPLLPILHILAAPHVLSFFSTRHLNFTITGSSIPKYSSVKPIRLHVLATLIIVNLSIGLYIAQVHQRGVIDVLAFLRHEYEELHLNSEGPTQRTKDACVNTGFEILRDGLNETFAAFLMPCHSTPWRSHLVHPNLRAWALTCEPPLHIPENTLERAKYRDEADRFYDDPQGFLKTEVKTKDRPWPRYIVGFEGIESILSRYCEAEMPGWEVRKKWSGFNSHWHDDWRRTGRVVVWEFVEISRAPGADHY